MKSKQALKEFRAHLRRGGHAATPNVPLTGFTQMLGFYRDVRVEDVSVENDGDMLLFQWGTYDWGQGLHFEVDLTRQLIRGAGEDDEIWQLHLTYLFGISEPLRALGKGDKWCASPTGAAVFEAFVMNHPVLAAIGSRDDARVEIEYECAG